MPESDEDYDRRNRDKFVRERGDYGGDRSRGRDFNADRYALYKSMLIVFLYIRVEEQIFYNKLSAILKIFFYD